MPTDAFITQSLPSLINGLSEQPPSQRLSSQCQVQDNMLSDVADGVRRRPPTEHLAVLGGDLTAAWPDGGYAIHTLDRGDDERFTVFVRDGDVFVYDTLTGTQKTVSKSLAAGSAGAYTYLEYDTVAHTAEDAFVLLTVADYTFVVNRYRNTTMSLAGPSATRAHAHEFFIFLKTSHSTASQGNLDVDFGAHAQIITIGGANTEVTGNNFMTAMGIAQDAQDTTGVTASAANWNFTRVNANVIHAYQSNVSGGLETIAIHDAAGDTTFVIVATSVLGDHPAVTRFSDLPAIGVDAFTVKVKGTDGSNNDDFFVKYVESAQTWVETVAPGLVNDFAADTMPHAVIYDGTTDTFTFGPLTWEGRPVGDASSAPEPSFIGHPIKDLLVHKNRMTVASDENVILGRAGQLFNFWPSTVSTILDSDPIDIASTGNRVSSIDYLVPYRGNLTLFSVLGDVQSEVIGSNQEPLTVRNTRVEERANYSLSDIRPKAVGDIIYYVLDHQAHSTVFQWQQVDVDVWRSDEITAHVPNFVPSGVVRVSASSSESTLVFFAGGATDNQLCVYRWHAAGSELLMSSWSCWTFAADDIIVGADWIESKLFVYIRRSDGIHLEVMDFGKVDEDQGAYTDNLGYRVYLDSLVKVTGTYDLVLDATTFAIPYDQATNGGTYMVVTGGQWGSQRGASVTITDATVDGSIKVAGDKSAFPCYIGRKTPWTYETSPIFMRGSDSLNASIAASRGRTGGRLQLRKGRVSFKDTGTFNVTLASSEDSDTYVDTFTSQFIGQAIVGQTGLDNGLFQFHIGGDSRNVRIIFGGDTFLPANLTSLDWDGRFYQHATQA